MASATWACPNCNRRVPSRVSTCHCGTTREQADIVAGAAPAAGWAAGAPALGELGWDVKGPAVGLVVVALAGIAWLFSPHRPDPIHPVLGYTDSPPPASPAPSPRRPVPPPLFKLPWWK